MSNAISTPYFLVDETRLTQNLEILRQVADQAGCKILLAQKAFSVFSCYPLLRRYLAGSTASGLYEARLGREHFGGETHVFSPAYKPEEFEELLSYADHFVYLAGSTASGLYEARLGREHFGGETHVFSPAYKPEEFEELLSYADHFVFNSPRQLQKFGPVAKAAGKAVGLRVNPECSTQEGHAIYDPCAPGSRLGTTLANFDESLLPLLDGLHFHTLCEQNSDDLETTVAVFEEKFGRYLHGLKWINLGGGHHITRKDYDRERLVRIVKHLKETYQVEVYLEPGEAVVLNAGFLVTSVLETLHNGMDIAILDTSAACHMPDVLEMPYRPCTTAWTLPFWIPPPPATCRTCWRCPTARPCRILARAGKRPTPTGWAAPPVWRGT